MKYYPLLSLLFFTTTIFAQSKETKRFTPGLILGIDMQSLGIQALDTREPDKAAVRSGRPGLGSSIGIFGRKHLWRGLFFQPALALSYTKNAVSYRTEGKQEFRFLDAEIPLHLVVTNWQKQEFPLRACVIFGGRLGWNFAQNPANLLKVSQERFGLDLGLGAEIKIKKWRLQPAFIYSHGLNNLHRIENAQYDDVVGNIVRDKLSLRISIWNIEK